jgi:RNA polymerase sigma-70 factor (ECF subfamily)
MTSTARKELKAKGFRVIEGSASQGGLMESSTQQSAYTDQELVMRACRGESIAFSQLVSKYYERSVRVAYGMLRSREDAEDVVQEAFCRAHRKLSSFEGQASFYTWFYRIVVNLCIDETRKRKRSKLVDLGDDVQAGPLATSDALYLNLDESDPTQSVERAQLRNVLMKAVAALPEIHRSVVVLREVEGLSYEEIADTLKIKKGTVMSRLFHARKALQQSLTKLSAEEVA